jgi:hypothetical protein
MSIFQEMHPSRQFNSLRDFSELKRMLEEAMRRGYVEEVPVMITRKVQTAEKWFRDNETGEIYSLSPPDPPSRGAWEPINVEELSRTDHRLQ